MKDEPMPADCQVIQVHVAELRQLFNSMDPAPFDRRDLDPAAEAFIVEWANDLSRHSPFRLEVHVDNPAAAPDEQQTLKESIQRFFDNRALSTRRRLRLLFQRGRVSLLIGIAFLSSSLIASEMLGQLLETNGFIVVLRESLLIGGWVAMWRPLEIFLYDWWPQRADIRVYERLRDMSVIVKHGQAAA